MTQRYIKSLELKKDDSEGKIFTAFVDLQNIPAGNSLVRADGSPSCTFTFPTGNAILNFKVKPSATYTCAGSNSDKQFTIQLGSPYNGDYQNAVCEIVVDGDLEITTYLRDGN